MSTDLIKARIMTVMRNLPPLPEVTHQLLAVLRDEDSSADDVTKVLSGDGTLAAKVLKLVNSSFYGVPTEVKTISRAVVILGFNGIRNLTLSFGTVEALSSMGGKADMTGYWSHAMAAAAAAQSLAPFVNRRTDPEEAFLAGLMHDIGTYVLAVAVPENYGEITALPASKRLLLEHEKAGLTHSKVGQGLLKFWGLPEAFSNAARYHHDVNVATAGDQPLTNLVAVADILASIYGGDFETDASEDDLNRLVIAAGLKQEHLFVALNAMDTKIEEMAEFMKIAGAGTNLKKPAWELPPMTGVIVTTDEPRRSLGESLLAQFGHTVFPMDSFFNQNPGSQDVDLVLVDPQSLSIDQLNRLAVFLDSQPIHSAVLVEENSTIPQSMSSWPTINFLFSGKQLAQVVSMKVS